MKNFIELEQILIILKKNCLSADGINYDTSKSNLLLETFALEIQLCDAIKDKKRMKRIFP